MKNLILSAMLVAALLFSANNSFAAAKVEDYAKAVEYYNIGKYADVIRILTPMAAVENIPAMVLLGRCYENGVGVPQDNETAVKWYAKAAALGDAEGQMLLGYAYESGSGVSQNQATAMQLYQQSANSGFADAQYKLGMIYHEGRGVEADKSMAAKFFLQAGEQLHVDAELMLVAYYKYGLGGLPKDAAISNKWLQKAISQGGQYDSQIFEKVK